MKRLTQALLLTSVAAFAAVAPSPVADAASRGDKPSLRQLIANKTDVNAAQADGATALHWAVYRGDKEMVDMLLAAGANPKVASREGSTPMWLASVAGSAGILDSLIKAGASPNEELPLGRKPLMAAARTGNVAAIAVLVEAGADVNAKDAERGTTPIMWAADEGHAEAIAYLASHGGDIAAASSLTERGRGPALGKANDPRRQVAAQGAALAQGRALGLNDVSTLRDGTGAAGAQAGQGAPQAGPGGRGGQGRQGGAAGGRAGAGAAGAGGAGGDDDDAGAAVGLTGGAGGRRRNQPVLDGGGLTPLVYAARANSVDSVKALLAAGADINQTTAYGWSPLLVATQNRYYKLASFLIDNGADVNLANKGGWVPLYLATDNRNIESGDYPVRQPDMDHLEFIKLLIAKGADVNHRIKDSTQTRTVFTNQWLDENGATAFLRASQSGDVVLMKLLLEHGADPKINTELNVTPLHVAAGNGWVEGITYEWSPQASFEAVKLLLDLGVDPNVQADTGRTALHGAAHKGRVDVIQALYDAGAKLDTRDYGNTDNRGGKLAVHTWQAIDYADGLVRVGVQSAISHPEAANLLRTLMEKEGLAVPPEGRTLESICITEACDTGEDAALPPDDVN